jgi:hypothetical protein
MKVAYEMDKNRYDVSIGTWNWFMINMERLVGYSVKCAVPLQWFTE